MLDVYVSVFVRRRALSFVYKSLIYNFFLKTKSLLLLVPTNVSWFEASLG